MWFILVYHSMQNLWLVGGVYKTEDEAKKIWCELLCRRPKLNHRLVEFKNDGTWDIEIIEEYIVEKVHVK
ncbi:hypothetical protein E308F_29580 [Moorella sp. E308F]|uniref:hypothetical protein n=1 Tax=Moorella sp. E308F TaxID=2572682 RepID=UPI0010FFB251|nr:hypothetical protein [Moorella sp. E308F]GEA16712.1 hypothetical protein E308F_29580 [Moorella sp. E308F]